MHNFDALMEASQTIAELDLIVSDESLSNADKIRKMDKVIADYAASLSD